MTKNINIVPRYRVDEINKKYGKNEPSSRKKTTEQYKVELEAKNPNIEVLEEYINAKTKILHRCLKHNINWLIAPSKALRGQGCVNCRSDKIKNKLTMTNDEYIVLLAQKNPNIIPLEDYKGNKVKILHKYIKCGCENIVTPTSALQGFDCDKCTRAKSGEKRKKTHSQFITECKTKNPNIKINGKYIGAHNNIECQCLICGYIWNPSATSLLMGYGCPNCAKNIKYTHEEFMKLFSSATTSNPNVKIVGKYKGMNKHIACECLICGYSWMGIPSNLLNGYGCYKCSRTKIGLDLRLSNEEFAARIKENNPYIKLKSTYKTMNDRIDCQCIICGYNWFPFARDLSRGRGCPICNMSYGEREIMKFLDTQNIKYIPQKSFDNLFGLKGGLLSYDFYLPIYNLLIEFQGEQHEKPHFGIFGGDEAFIKQQEHDSRKREYAKQNNINLLEIWYYDIDNIEEILTNKLNNLKLESVETAISA